MTSAKWYLSLAFAFVALALATVSTYFTLFRRDWTSPVPRFLYVVLAFMALIAVGVTLTSRS